MEPVKNNSFGAWIKESKIGNKYISFSIEGKRYRMFKNTKKTQEKQPDYNILGDDENTQATNSTVYAPTVAKPATVQNVDVTLVNDDLPF